MSITPAKAARRRNRFLDGGLPALDRTQPGKPLKKLRGGVVVLKRQSISIFTSDHAHLIAPQLIGDKRQLAHVADFTVSDLNQAGQSASMGFRIGQRKDLAGRELMANTLNRRDLPRVAAVGAPDGEERSKYSTSSGTTLLASRRMRK